MKKSKNRFFLVFVICLSLFVSSFKNVNADSNSVKFQWNYVGDSSKLNLTALEFMKQTFYQQKRTGSTALQNLGFTTYENYFNLGSYFVVYDNESNRYTFYYSYNSYVPLSSYVYRDTGTYYLKLHYDQYCTFDNNFQLVGSCSGSDPSNPGSSGIFVGGFSYTIYSSGTYSHLYNEEDIFKMDFKLIAGNHDFKLLNNSGSYTRSMDSSNPCTFIPVNDYDLGDVIISPFNNYGLIENNDYSQTMTYTFNSNDSTAVRIYYDVLEGSVEKTSYEISNNWFKKFFGIKDKITTTIDIDNFTYYVMSNNSISAPFRYYSDKKKQNYKRLPRDTDLLVGTSFSGNVKTLNYNDGVRSGYIYFDLSNAPSDTTVTLSINYNPNSVKFLGLEKSDSFDSLTELDISNYYGVGLIPKFDLADNFYSFPLYYKGNLGFSYGGNFKTSNNTNFYGMSSNGSTTEYKKYLIDFSKLSYVDVDTLEYYNKPYLFISNLDLSNNAFIRYNSNYFDVVYFSNSDSCSTINDKEYCAVDVSNWKWGSIDSNGNGSSGTTFKNNNDSVFVTWGSDTDDEVSKTKPLDFISNTLKNIGNVIEILTGALVLLGSIFGLIESILPPVLVYVINCIIAVTGFTIIFNFVKKLL